MTTFLTDRSGRRLINTADIEEITERPDEKGTMHCVARLRGGGEVALQGELESGRLAQMLTPVIPAAPGYEVLIGPSDRGPLIRDPVIGWRIGLYIDPITLHLDITRGGTGWVIKAPNGRVIEQEIQEWESEEDWLEDMKQLTAKREAAEARPERRKKAGASKAPAEKPHSVENLEP
jgi:hypothetical protein